MFLKICEINGLGTEGIKYCEENSLLVAFDLLMGFADNRKRKELHQTYPLNVSLRTIPHLSLLASISQTICLSGAVACHFFITSDYTYF